MCHGKNSAAGRNVLTYSKWTPVPTVGTLYIPRRNLDDQSS